VESEAAERRVQRDPDTVDFTPRARQLQRLGDRLGVDRLSSATVVLGVSCLVAVGLGIWLTAGAWGPRPPAGDDVTAYAIRTDFAIDHLIPRLRVDGWAPSFMLGYQEFLFLGPGSSWAIALLRGLTLGTLSTIGAVKVVAILGFVTVPFAVAFLATSLGLSRRAAGLAGIMALAVNNPFGGGLQAIYNVGLIAQQVAVPFFFLALAGMVRLVRDPRRRWTALTAVSVGAVVVTHTPSLAVLGLLMAVILVASAVNVGGDTQRLLLQPLVQREVARQLHQLGIEPDKIDAAAADPPPPAPPPVRVDRDAVVRLGLAVLAGAALAACVLLPAYGHRDLQGPFIGWGTPPLGERLAQVWRGEFLFRPNVAPLVLAGFVYGLVRVFRRRPFALAVLVAPLAYMVAAHVLQHEWPSSLVMQQLSNRGIGYAGILALFPLAALVARMTASLEWVGDLIAVTAAFALVVVPLGPTRDFAREMMVPVPQMGEAAQELARVVPEHARFATQRDFPGEIARTNMIHPDRWLAWKSGRNTLNIFHATSSVAAGPAFETDHIVDRPPEAVAESLSRYGVSHLVTVSDPAADQIAGSSRFTTVWRSSPLAIFAITPNAGQPEPATQLTADGPVSAQVLEAEPERLVFQVTATQPVRAQVALTWSPKWHATVDGRSVPVGRSDQGVVFVPVPDGTHRLVLTFRQDLWDRLGLLVSLATVAGGVVWFRRSRRHQPATATTA
jgi:hypothetical protein